jgi:hypothetical protein
MFGLAAPHAAWAGSYTEAKFVACLSAFDAKARAKKLSPEMYKTAIEGACTVEERDARAMNELNNVGHDADAYPPKQYEKMLADRRAEMVTKYIMN